MLEYLIDNIFVEFGGRIYQQTIGVPMGTNYAPLLADLFCFVCFIRMRRSFTRSQQFNLTYRYIDDVLTLKYTKFVEYLEFIYPSELEIKETTQATTSTLYLDCYLFRLFDKTEWLQLSHCELSVSEQLYPFSTSIRSLRFTVNPVCKSLFRVSGLYSMRESAQY